MKHMCFGQRKVELLKLRKVITFSNYLTQQSMKKLFGHFGILVMANLTVAEKDSEEIKFNNFQNVNKNGTNNDDSNKRNYFNAQDYSKAMEYYLKSAEKRKFRCIK